MLASLGCGNPTAVADLREGETVLDLGSGGGIDVLLSAKRVGASGFAYGLDMTDEMLDLARAAAAKAGATNVEFLKGQIEKIPLEDASVDVIISNCVINLSTDKSAVLRESFRVLKPGGRLGVSDVVAENQLSPSERAERGSYVGCIAGALSVDEYRAGLAAAGFIDIDVRFTHEVAPGMHGAIVKAIKPAACRPRTGNQRPPSRRVTCQVTTSASCRAASVTRWATDTAAASSSQVNRTVSRGAPRTTLRSEASSVVSACAAAAAAGSTDWGATPRRRAPTAMVTRKDGIRPAYAASRQPRRHSGGPIWWRYEC